MGKYPEGLPEPKMHVPIFHRAEAIVMEAVPLPYPDRVAKWDDDIENKEGWTIKEALKDAFADGFRDGVKAFKETTGEELEEWVDWNMEYALYEVRIPKLGFKVWTFRVKHIAKWLKKRFNG